MKISTLAIAVVCLAFASPSPGATAGDAKACRAGSTAACKHWRDRSCNEDANPAACDYDEARKQKDPIEWCQQRWQDNAPAYRWCVNGSPDR